MLEKICKQDPWTTLPVAAWGSGIKGQCVARAWVFDESQSSVGGQG